ncbi:hypothetical protein AAZV13_10G007750 [Glycine max]
MSKVLLFGVWLSSLYIDLIKFAETFVITPAWVKDKGVVNIHSPEDSCKLFSIRQNGEFSVHAIM